MTDIEVSGSAHFVHPTSLVEWEVQLVCVVDFGPEQPELNLGATSGAFLHELDAAGLRLPQELEDMLYWNGAMAGMRLAYEVLRGSLPRRTWKNLEFFVDIRRLVIEPFPTVTTPPDELRLLGDLLGDLAAALIANGVRLLLASKARSPVVSSDDTPIV